MKYINLKYCLILVAILSIQLSFSQDISIKYILQESNYVDANYSNYTSNSKILTSKNNAFGINIHFRLIEVLKFQTGLFYSRQIQEITSSEQINNQSNLETTQLIVYDFEYIKIPLQLKIIGNKKDGKRLYFNLAVGPQLSIIKSAGLKVSQDKNAPIYFSPIDEDYKNKLKNPNLDISGNIGIDIRVYKNLFLYLGFNFDHSLTEPNKVKVKHITNGSENRVVSSTVSKGIIFGLSIAL